MFVKAIFDRDLIATINYRLKNENRGCNNRRVPVVLDDSGLRNIACANDFAADFEYFLFLIPTFVNIKINAEGRSQHGGSQVFRVITGFLFRPAKSMVLTDIAIGFFISGNGQSDRRSQQAARFVAATSAHHTICDGSCL